MEEDNVLGDSYDYFEAGFITQLENTCKKWLELKLPFGSDIDDVKYNSADKKLNVSYYNRSDKKDKAITDSIEEMKRFTELSNKK